LDEANAYGYKMTVTQNAHKSYTSPRVLPEKLLASGLSKSSRSYQNAIKARFELDYIGASGSIQKENTFVYAVYQMARSSLSTADRRKGLNLLFKRAIDLEGPEREFVTKAYAFLAEANESEGLKAKDAKLLEWVNKNSRRTFRHMATALATKATISLFALQIGLMPELALAPDFNYSDNNGSKSSHVLTLDSPKSVVAYNGAPTSQVSMVLIDTASKQVPSLSLVKPAVISQPILLADNQSPVLTPGSTGAINGNQPAPSATTGKSANMAEASGITVSGLDVGIMEDGPAKTTPPMLVGNGPGAFLTPGTSQSVGNERAYSATVANFGAQSLSVFAGISRFSALDENSSALAVNYSNTNYLNSNYYGAVRTDENTIGSQSLSAGLFMDQQTPLKKLSVLADVSYLPTTAAFNVPGPNLTELVGNGPGAFLTSVPTTITVSNIQHSVSFGIGGEYKLSQDNSIFGSFADVYGKSFYTAGYKFERGADLFGLRVDYTSGSDPIPSAYVAGKTFMGKVSYSPSTSELSGFGEYALWGTVIPSYETSQPLVRNLEAPVGTVFGPDFTFGSWKPAGADLEPDRTFAFGVSGSIADDLNNHNMQQYYFDAEGKFKISRRFEVGVDGFTEKETGINGASNQNEGVGAEIQYNFNSHLRASLGGGVTKEGGFVKAMLRF